MKRKRGEEEAEGERKDGRGGEGERWEGKIIGLPSFSVISDACIYYHTW